MAESNLTEITVWYQTLLKVAGDQHTLIVDGKYGSSTRRALECFQDVSQLAPSGVLDVPTNVALNQVAMEWVYRKRLSTTPGMMTEELRSALKRFQNDYGLEADGKVGPATRDVMIRVLRTELPSPLRFYHAHLGQGLPAVPEPQSLGVESATSTDEDEDADPPGIIPDAGPDDDRELTANTLDRPFRWVCLVNPTYDTGSFGWGSGLLISPRHVLTAAHVILDNIDDSKGRRELRAAGRVFVYPGYDGRGLAQRPDGIQPFERWMGPVRHTPDCYRKCGRTCDYALIELEQPIGDRTFELRVRSKDGKRKVVEKVKLGYWGDSSGFEIRAVKQPDLDGVQVFSAGYPKDRSKQQIQAPGLGIDNAAITFRRDRLPECYRNILGSSIDLIAGQSGSPVWRHVEKDGKSISQLVGLMTEAATREYNYAVALTDEVLTQIVNWAPKTFKYLDGRLTIKK